MSLSAKKRQRITSLFADATPRINHFAPKRPPAQPAVATDHAHGYRMRGGAVAALVHYDGGANALSLGPHHNRMSRLQARGVEVGALEVFKRKVDMRIEILSAALYAEGYSVADLAVKSEQVFGIKLSESTILGCVRRAFGVNFQKMGAKQRTEYVEKAKKLLAEARRTGHNTP